MIQVFVNPCPYTFGRVLFVIVWARLLPVKGNLNATVYNEVFVATVEGSSYPVLTWQCPQSQTEVHIEMVFPVWCGRT